MELVSVLIVLGIMVLISFIAMHLWVFIWDAIIGGFKRLFGLHRKKEKINWHTLDKSTTEKNKDDITIKNEKLHENESLYD